MSKFRLQSVLDYREVLENEAIQAFTLAQEEKRKICAEYDREKEGLSAQLAEFEERQSHGISPDEYVLYQNYIDRLKEKVVALETQVARCTALTEERHADFCLASRDKKLLEKFKAKQLDLEKRKAEAKERNFLDEIALRTLKR